MKYTMHGLTVLVIQYISFAVKRNQVHVIQLGGHSSKNH